jgi:hypothetical protein
MEEIDMRIKETKQETYEFKRDVILGQWRIMQTKLGPPTQLPPARLQDCLQLASIANHASNCEGSAALHTASQGLWCCAMMSPATSKLAQSPQEPTAVGQQCTPPDLCFGAVWCCS